MSRAVVIALGNEAAGDDGAAVRAVVGLRHPNVIVAGRPGPGLLDLLEPDRPTVLVDVVVSGQPPGTILERPLAELVRVAVAEHQTSSHGFGPAEALRLGDALGRRLPPGVFVGIEGRSFQPGTELTPAVAAQLPALRAAIEAQLRRQEMRQCTKAE